MAVTNESIARSLNFSAMDSQSQDELRRLFMAVFNELEAMKARMLVISAKMDADVGITDTNYGVTLGAQPDILNP